MIRGVGYEMMMGNVTERQYDNCLILQQPGMFWLTLHVVDLIRLDGWDHAELAEIRHRDRSGLITICPHDVQLGSADHNLLTEMADEKRWESSDRSWIGYWYRINRKRTVST
jgi:hypothetical protein